MHTIEVDDETYASLEALAKREQASVGSVLKRALSRLPGMRKQSVHHRRCAEGRR